MEQYWTEKSEEITWFRKWDKLHNWDGNPTNLNWFVGGKINVSYDVLDKNVADGHGDDVALVWESPFTNTVTRHTYRDLLHKVSHLAGLLSECGVEEGDHVLIYLPAVVEASVALLASVRLGAIFSFVCTIQPAQAMADRFEDFRPKVVLTTNCEFESGNAFNSKHYLDTIIDLSQHKPHKCIVLQRDCATPADMRPSRDVDWNERVSKAQPREPVPVDVNKTMFVIYTSGTTGKPKGVMIPGRYVVAILVQATEALVGTPRRNGERAVFYSGSRFVWIMGSFASCLMPLWHRALAVLWEKPIADATVEEFYHILSTYQVTSTFVSTATLRALKKQDPVGAVATKYMPQIKLKQVWMGGSPGDKGTFDWLLSCLKVNGAQLYGLTETGLISYSELNDDGNLRYQPEMSSGRPAPGRIVKVFVDKNVEAAVDEVGKIAVKLPDPTITAGYLNDTDSQKLISGYLSTFPGYFETHDEGRFDADGFLYVLNRSDSLFKVKGNRITCDALEDVMLLHPEVGECVVVIKTSSDLVQLPVAFFVMNEGCQKSVETVKEELKQLVSEKIGSWVPFDDLTCVKSLPKGFTGKIVRGAVQAMVNDKLPTDMSDPVIQNFWNLVQGRKH